MAVIWAARSGDVPFGTAIASLGRGADVHTILLASGFTLPLSIMALRLRSKSVAKSTCPFETATSFAAWVDPS